MINLKIRRDAYQKIKGNLQYALLVAFFAEILNTVLRLYISSFVTEDFIYSIQDGVMPRIAPNQIKTIGYILLAIILLSPILRLGSVKFFLKLYRGKDARFSDIITYIRRPFRAWFAYGFLMLLYAMWAALPLAIYYILIRFASVNMLMMFSWLLYIPIFYAGVRYFAYIYIISEDDSIGFVQAAKKSAAMLKGNGVLLLSMLAYFMIINMIFAMVEGALLGLGVFGTTISLFINLGIKTWMLASLAGLFCFLNGEKIGIIIENIKIENDEDLRNFLNNKFKMLERHNDENINIPIFDSKEEVKEDLEEDSEELEKSDEKSNKEDYNIADDKHQNDTDDKDE